MTDKINDGGPAFSHGICIKRRDFYSGTEYEDSDDFHPGMSLRDWFAGQALAGILASMANERWRDVMMDLADDDGVSLETHVSLASLDIADAMLKVRNA